MTGFIHPRLYQAVVIASGLRLYAKTGMKPNRAYTPSAMMRVAENILGRKFRAREYLVAADALSAWAKAQTPETANG